MPDISTEEVISSTILTTSASSISLTSIPNTYTDLRLCITGSGIFQSNAYNVNYRITFNSDTATNYSTISINVVGATGNSPNMANNSNDTSIRAGAFALSLPANYMYSTSVCDILSYSGNKFKNVISSFASNISTAGRAGKRLGTWRSTSAITSIQIFTDGYNLKPGTIVTLYGIL
jgi:hypothetical protein